MSNTLDVIKQMIADNVLKQNTAEEYFPELKESEDERVRKEIIDFIYDKTDTYELREKSNSWLAWLEKQDKPKEINPSEFDSQLNRLLGQFKSLPKEELASSLSFYLNVVQNDAHIIFHWLENKLKFFRPQRQWKSSEEDEKMRAAVLQLITDSEKENGWNCVYCNDKEIYFSDIIAWLKSFKDRLQPQPKQEWSEEDERMYRGLHNLIYSTPYCDSRREFSDWFESLKNRVQPQQEWSEEQMKALKDACDEH